MDKVSEINVDSITFRIHLIVYFTFLECWIHVALYLASSSQERMLSKSKLV